jgi:hypothetical protein
MNRHRQLAKLVGLRTRTYCWLHFPRKSRAFEIVTKGYREEHDWVEEFVSLVPGLYFGYFAYAQLSDG